MEEFTFPNRPESSADIPSQPEQKHRIWVIVGITAGALLLFLTCCCCLLLTLLVVEWPQVSQWLTGG